MAESSSSSTQWNFYQTLRRHNIPANEDEEDFYITAIHFDKRGHFLATGDEGGRVVVFQRDDRKNVTSYPHKFLEELDYAPDQRPKFRFKTEFQSHEFQTDKESHAAISERIKKVSWCVAQRGLLLLLSANTNKIKLWTIKESERVNPLGPPPFLSSENVLMSKTSPAVGQEASSSTNGGRSGEWTENLFQENDAIAGTDNTFHAKCKKEYAHDPHEPHNSGDINSISNNSDGQSFISADEYEINLWYLEVKNKSFTLVSMKPSETGEMITSAQFHPVQCNLLAYGSSGGRIRISDMREEINCNNSARVFDDPSLSNLNPPYEKKASWISDVKFRADDGIGGQQVISRDYMTMKIWDMRMGANPVAIYGVHEQLRPSMDELYDDELMQDQFDCCSRRDGLFFATGSYSNRLKIFSPANERVEDIKLDVIGDISSHEMPSLPRGTVRRWPIRNYNIRAAGLEQANVYDALDFEIDSKLLRVAWHPTSNLVAGVVKSGLMFYHI